MGGRTRPRGREAEKEGEGGKKEEEKKRRKGEKERGKERAHADEIRGRRSHVGDNRAVRDGTVARKKTEGYGRRKKAKKRWNDDWDGESFWEY